MHDDKPSFMAFVRNEHLLEHVKTLYLGSDLEQAKREANEFELRPGHAAVVKSMGIVLHYRPAVGLCWSRVEA